MKSGYFLFAVFFLIVSGCKYDPASNLGGSTKKTPTGLGFTLNGISIDSKSDPADDYAQAIMDPRNNPLFAKDMSVQIFSHVVIGGLTHSIYIEFEVPSVITAPAKYSIPKYGNGLYPSVIINYDTSTIYACRDGGMLEITKFDTVNNLISGTFSFTAYYYSPTVDSSRIDTVTGGYFTDIPIIANSYGQGRVAADINNVTFDTQLSPLYTLSSVLPHGLNDIEIYVHSPNTEAARELHFEIHSPKMQDYNFSSEATDSTAVATYWETIGSQQVMISSSPLGASGKLSITKCDTVHHRFSAKFNLSGYDEASDQTITIANGVIDNLQWSTP